jgi:hypothetical protein
MKLTNNWRGWLLWLISGLWFLQLIWLAWYYAPDVQDMAWRVASRRTGPAIRQEDPFYLWTLTLAAVIPPRDTYIFLDNYEAGKEIEARYHLIPRKHVLLPPAAPPSFLFHALRQEKASYLVIREGDKAWSSADAAAESAAFLLLPVPGQGLVFQVDYERLLGRFYD